ncbi:pectinesterase [Trifolium pratense]|uniref:Pectinesterase n=1 Tax=Trifolium pratense TaxID=57577 RepID=A0A2K3L9Y1_TRIPR|nr:pectinesterase [Trifolium pratense]
MVKKCLPKQSNVITAEGGKFDGNPTAFSFQFCNITADFDLLPSIKLFSTFLGRPWKPYSTTVFMESYIGNLLSPKGWLAWKASENLDTLFYAEYKNFGPGGSTMDRVKWKGYHVLNYPRQAINFTVSRLI